MVYLFRRQDSADKVRIIARRTLNDYGTKYAEAKPFLEAWYADADKAVWQTPQDITDRYAHASILRNSRVVFNIKGRDYRLIVKVEYSLGIVFIRWFGTHDDYNKIDADTI
jgi:mRNA interferase HigB